MTTVADITRSINLAITAHQIDLAWYDRSVEWYDYYGLRFENANRQIGDICNNSRHNPDRTDERDFPAYDTLDYDDLPILDGSSAWMIDPANGYYQKSYAGWRGEAYSDEEFRGSDHCYIVAGNRRSNHDDADYNEIVICDAKVIAVIF
jgi:hypothetical protein